MTYRSPRSGALPLFLSGLALLTAACTTPGEGHPTAGGVAGPRAIVLVTVDGLTPEQLSFLGGESQATPRLAALADEGRVWADTWTACPMTRPAVTSYLTGLAPDVHGVRDDLFTSLADGTPTLAAVLGERGYETAAFPGSHFLGFDSRLLEDFDLVDDPPGLPIGPDRWLPLVRPASETAEHVRTWLESLPAERRYFAWVHFADPLLEQLTKKDRRREKLTREMEQGAGPRKRPAKRKAADEELMAQDPAVDRVDAAVGAIVDALRDRGDLEHAAILVAGTLGDQRGGETGLFGPGFSVEPAALRVPLIVRLPGGSAGELREAEQRVWSLDVARTVADLGGAALAPEAEGKSLFEAAEPDRVLYAWAWATQDQAGWLPYRAALSGNVMRVEGLETRTAGLDGADPPAEAGARLGGLLARRASPAPPTVELAEVREVLEAQGLELDPTPAEGRAFGTPDERREATLFLWDARAMLRGDGGRMASRLFARVLEVDPRHKSALLERGILLFYMGSPESREVLSAAVEAYPGEPEAIHWYAHSLWSESWQTAEKLIAAILPDKAHDADVLYDLACSRSLAQDVESSAQYLRQAIEAGFRQWAHMEADPDLRHLRESGRFSEVVREYRR